MWECPFYYERIFSEQFFFSLVKLIGLWVRATSHLSLGVKKNTRVHSFKYVPIKRRVRADTSEQNSIILWLTHYKRKCLKRCRRTISLCIMFKHVWHSLLMMHSGKSSNFSNEKFHVQIMKKNQIFFQYKNLFSEKMF